MKTIVGILAAVIASETLQAADPPGFAIWKAADLRSHDAALSTHVADDHSSRPLTMILVTDCTTG